MQYDPHNWLTNRRKRERNSHHISSSSSLTFETSSFILILKCECKTGDIQTVFSKKQSLFFWAQVNYYYNVWGRNKSALENGLRQRICPLCNFEHLFLPEERHSTGKVLENGACAQCTGCSVLSLLSPLCRIF